jgi:exopolysaccharide biosynthesis predicted pyruvyltransferase EpsI
VERNLAKQYANKYNFKIATIPYLNGYTKNDEDFGDYKIFDAGVEDFLSLIKNAEYVFTDSFHAAVFSGVFEKQYIVFQRNGAEYMASRIYTLCELYETQERFCDTKEKATLEYIERLENINYKRPLNKLNGMKEKSIEYLKRNLEK